jgi:hypothetical protein
LSKKEGAWAFIITLKNTMHLLKTYLFLISLWKPAICKESAYERMREHAMGVIKIGRKDKNRANNNQISQRLWRFE